LSSEKGLLPIEPRHRPANRFQYPQEGRIQAIPQAQPPEGVGQSLFQDGVAHLLTIQYFAREVEALWWTGRASFAKAGLLSDQPRRGAGSKAASMGV
jgi:hypothetical protein